MNFKRVFIGLFIFTILIGSFLFVYFYKENKVKAADLAYCVKWGDSAKTIIEDNTIISVGENCPAGFEFFSEDGSSDVSQNQNVSTTNTPTVYLDTSVNNTNTNFSNVNNVNNNEYIIQIDKSLEYGRFTTLDATDYTYCVLLSKDFGFGDTDATTNREVTALQSYLMDRGFLDTYPTGYFGSFTQLALKKFQYRNEIPVLGSVDSNTREILKDLTCTMRPIISYREKPLSPSLLSSSSKTSTVAKSSSSAKTTTIIPATNAATKSTATKSSSSSQTQNKTIVPQTTNTSSPSTLSSVYGNMYLSQKKSLYFNYNSKAVKPYICIGLNNVDCSIPSNYSPVTEGINTFYEVMNIGNGWAFTLYNGSAWGQIGDKVRIYIKDNQNSSSISVYTLSVLN